MKHGGDLAEAIRRYGIPDDDWLDLSTGINPQSYPIRNVHAASWTALPQTAALRTLLAAARRSYGASEDAPIFAAPGTQIIIQLLPIIHPASKVVIVATSYGEHSQCWEQSGASVTFADTLDEAADADVIVAVNPNNPDGRIWTPEKLLARREELAARGGLLIIDEAFADVAPEVSLAGQAGKDALVILRSFGKFFGLAGLRLGFALGPAGLLAKLDALLGPWAVSGLALDIGRQALADDSWQLSARAQCYQMSAAMDDLLSSCGLQLIGGTALFRLVAHGEAQAIHDHLAKNGIWTRRFAQTPERLRFGIPADDAGLERLATALKTVRV